MKRHGSIPMILWFLGIAANLAFVQSVSAFVLTGHDWTYQTMPMDDDYVIDTGFTIDERAHIQAAAATWSQVSDNFAFTYGGTVSDEPIPAYDGVNQIKWDTNVTSGALAITTYWTNSSGDILGVDCQFNANYNWSTATPTPSGYYDIQSVMLHEFGHYLALDHSVPPAVMQPTIPDHTQRRSLTDDDVNGLKAVYDPDDPIDPPEGWGGAAPPASVVGSGKKAGQSSDIVNYLLILAIPGGVLWFLWRKRLKP